MSESDSTSVYLQGETIFRQGESGYTAYVVRRGQVKIYREAEDGSEELVAVRGPGEMIGEMAVASEGARSATAKAMSKCLLMTIRRLQIEQRIEEADPILKLLVLTAFERLRETATRSEQPTPAHQR